MSCILTNGSYTALIPLAHPFKPRRRGEQERNGESEREADPQTMPYCERVGGMGRLPQPLFQKIRTYISQTWMDAQHTKHVTYKLGYHFVWCLKYRKRILVGKIATFIEREIRRLCAEQNWTIGALNIQPDHVHLFLSAPPTVAPSEIAHQL